MKYIKRTVFVLMGYLFLSACMKAGQTDSLDINYELAKNRLKINGQITSGGVHYSKLLMVIGAGNRKTISTDSTEKRYFYDSLGITVTTINDTISNIYVSLKADREKKVPVLRGKLSIEKTLITDKTTPEELLKIPGVTREQIGDNYNFSSNEKYSWNLFYNTEQKCFTGASFSFQKHP